MPATVTKIAQFARGGLDVGSLSLHLEGAKSLLGRLQGTMGRVHTCSEGAITPRRASAVQPLYSVYWRRLNMKEYEDLGA